MAHRAAALLQQAALDREARRVEVEHAELLALALLQRAVDQGDPASAAAMGMLYELGERPIRKDAKKASEFFKMCAALGGAALLVQTAQSYERGEMPPENPEAQAVELYSIAADHDDELGLLYLGVMTEQGRGGLRKDVDKAVGLYQRSASLGNLQAIEKLRLLGRKSK